MQIKHIRRIKRKNIFLEEVFSDMNTEEDCEFLADKHLSAFKLLLYKLEMPKEEKIKLIDKYYIFGSFNDVLEEIKGYPVYYEKKPLIEMTLKLFKEKAKAWIEGGEV